MNEEVSVAGDSNLRARTAVAILMHLMYRFPLMLTSSFSDDTLTAVC